MYSALKRDGVPLYKLARRGIEVERAARDIEIGRLELTARGTDAIDFARRVLEGHLRAGARRRPRARARHGRPLESCAGPRSAPSGWTMRTPSRRWRPCRRCRSCRSATALAGLRAFTLRARGARPAAAGPAGAAASACRRRRPGEAALVVGRRRDGGGAGRRRAGRAGAWRACSRCDAAPGDLRALLYKPEPRVRRRVLNVKREERKQRGRDGSAPGAYREIVQTNRRHETDTGSPEVQIALLTIASTYLTEHFKAHARITIPVAGCSSSWASAGGCSTT